MMNSGAFHEDYSLRFIKFLNGLRKIISDYLEMGNQLENFEWLEKQIEGLLDEYFFFMVEICRVLKWFGLGDCELTQVTFSSASSMIAACISSDLHSLTINKK